MYINVWLLVRLLKVVENDILIGTVERVLARVVILFEKGFWVENMIWLDFWGM